MTSRGTAADRLQILSETMRSFALATADPRRLADTVAARIAVALDAYCGFALVSGDGQWLEPVAVHDRDWSAADLIARLAAATEPVRVDGAHPLAEALRTGECLHLTQVSSEIIRARFPSADAQEVALQLGIRSVLFVPLHVQGETVGGFSIVRHGATASPFTADDLSFAQTLADHAALALKTARLLARARDELAERNRMADRLRLLSELTKEFLGATDDPAALLLLVARRISEVVGEACSIRLLSPDGQHLDPVGATHDPKPELSTAVMREIEARPQRVGEGISGRVAVDGESVLIPGLSPEFLAGLDPRYRAMGEALGVRSMLAVALRDGDHIAGVIVVYRRDPEQPYTVDDRQLLEDIAAHASLALTNSRLLDASRRELAERMRSEQIVRRGFLEAAPDPVLIIDATGRIVLVNSQTETVFGYGRAELMGQPVALLAPLTLADRNQELIARRRDGSEFAAEASLSPIETPDGPLVAATVRDVSERRRELEERNRKTQEANRLKSEFLANMSHELRTPLNAIIGFSALMHAGKAGPIAELHKEYLGDILSSSHHLLQLINDILDLAKVEAGRVELRPEAVDLPRVAGEVRDILRGLATDKKIDLAIEVGLSGAVLDPRMLKQILYNFLSNAIKFTPEGGRVTLRIDPDGDDHLRIDVEDTGIGIKPEDLSRLFVEFQQLDASSTKRYPGTGLGLALTRRLIEAHGGRVEVESTPGVGSKFSAILPREVAALRG